MLQEMRQILLLFVFLALPSQSLPRKYTYKNWAILRNANWSKIIQEPTAFVVKSHVQLRSHPEGYKPGSRCANYVGMAYLDHILESRQTICSSLPPEARRWPRGPRKRAARDLQWEPDLSPSESTVDCYTAPHVPVGFSNKAVISLCRSRNMVLNSCAFFAGKRKGTLMKKFPLPAPGAVQLACDMANTAAMVQRDASLQWLTSVHHEVWWANASRDDSAVRNACAPNATNLVTTPTLFVMRDRHANYAHEIEVVSMAFSFLAALEPNDVAEQGVQVVVVDQAPPTGFLETWARISHPHRLRLMAHEPFPPGTCFRSAYHVYTFAAGIGYNTNSETVRCESPVVSGLSHWLRQLYEERDPQLAPDTHALVAGAAAATAGPYTVAAGVKGLRPPTAGIIMKNVVWLSRRNLELVRLLLNASVGWKAMRMVRNEDEVVAGILAAVQEWNAESCLLQRFDRVVQEEYEKALTTVHAVHLAPHDEANLAHAKKSKSRRRGVQEIAGGSKAAAKQGLAAAEAPADDEGRAAMRRRTPAPGGALEGPGAKRRSAAAGDAADGPKDRQEELQTVGRRLVAQQGGGGDIDEHGNDGEDEEEVDGQDGASKDAPTEGTVSLGKPGNLVTAAVGSALTKNGSSNSSSAGMPPGAGGVPIASAAERAAASWGAAARQVETPGFIVGTNTVLLDKLWEKEEATSKCRRSNVLFKFVDGDFNDMPYHQQLKKIFRTGVLVGVHGAGLTHGYFLPPGQSAVLQLLGESFAKVAANNVFRNMAAGVGNFYEDVLYVGVDVRVDVLKAAVKRAMDFVANQVMETQLKHSGGSIPLVLDDQNHFSVVAPTLEQCPRNRTMRARPTSTLEGRGAQLSSQPPPLQGPLG